MGALLEHGKRIAAWCAIVAVGILSLLPGAEMNALRTSMGGHAEHLLVYAATTMMVVAAYVDHSRTKIALSLLLYAAVLEYLQRYSPGRLSSLTDLAFSSLGVFCGLVTFRLIQHLRQRPALMSRSR